MENSRLNKSETQLRREVLAVLKALPDGSSSKEDLRLSHSPAVRVQLELSQPWIKSNYPKYATYFANGAEVDPVQIRPALIEVREEWQADLFRLARLTWSLPFTKGYGRRLRFLILDKHNEKLIGILGLQSPPLDFPARDRLYSYPDGRKVELVNQTMDIYTLGAIPPYNRLLGGKLAALAAASDEVRNAYKRKYDHRVTEMEKDEIPARLVALTTTSAFGRSSIYNRLTYNNRLVAKAIGYTEGYGSFHLAPLYPALCDYLEKKGISTRGGFGVGPRIVWQTYIRAMEQLGLPRDLLKHGVKREVFLFELASNLENYMNGRAGRPIFYHQSFADLANWWRERWLLARAERVDGLHNWTNAAIERFLTLKEP